MPRGYCGLPFDLFKDKKYWKNSSIKPIKHPRSRQEHLERGFKVEDLQQLKNGFGDCDRIASSSILLCFLSLSMFSFTLSFDLVFMGC